MKKLAFTLAEVLITLAIIGVIAAISVPSLIQKTNQAELITAWKKTFAAFSQADMFVSGDTSSSYAGYFTSSSDMANKFLNNFKTIKRCYGGDSNCWSSADGKFSAGLLNNTGTKFAFGLASDPVNSAIINNGSMVAFFLDRSDCKYSRTGNGGSYLNECGWALFDVNGFKNPNVLGKDIFMVWINADGVAPNTINDITSQGLDSTKSCKLGNSDGSDCSAYYLYSDGNK